ncbi:hypothetical protein EG329_013355 [Mollisiaceae sp. DMI_Dod_QoI]|nr:hypothetical protein EG329_013355 [Helotiales sp. DMI_Dod_QoI]
MISRRPKATCQCHRSLPFSSTLLFLSIVLPTLSFAQTTGPGHSPNPSSAPTTFQTSTASSSLPSPISNAPASTAEPDSPVIPSVPPSDPDKVQDHVFNYYFLIIAVVAVLLCICILYIGRRKKRKAALLRSQSQRALATDVAGFRARFGNRNARTGAGSYGGAPGIDGVEGLDERGEAPPPYVPGTKPPKAAGDVELGDMGGVPIHRPPDYNEHVDEAGLSVRRPDTVITASERFGSMRRLLSRTNSSTNV